MSIDITSSSDFDIRYTYGIEFTTVLTLVRQQAELLPVSSEMEKEYFARNWIYMGKQKASLTFLYKGEIVGFAVLFLMPYNKTKHLCQGYIMIDDAYKGRGVELRAIRNLGHLAKTQCGLKKLYFKEFEGCYLIPFLQTSGYKKLYTQKEYLSLGQGGYKDRDVYEKELGGKS